MNDVLRIMSDDQPETATQLTRQACSLGFPKEDFSQNSCPLLMDDESFEVMKRTRSSPYLL